MSETKIAPYIRIRLSKYIKSSKEKNICEECGNDKNLQVHHSEVSFDEMFNKSLELTNLPYLEYSNSYSKRERELLFLVVLGLHRQSKLKTLCRTCHNNENIITVQDSIRYIKFKKRYKDLIKRAESEGFVLGNIDKFKSDYNKKHVPIILSKYTDKKIFKKEKRELVKELIDNTFHHLRPEKVGIRIVRNIISEYFRDYHLITKTSKVKGEIKENQRRDYWLITIKDKCCDE